MPTRLHFRAHSPTAKKFNGEEMGRLPKDTEKFKNMTMKHKGEEVAEQAQLADLSAEAETTSSEAESATGFVETPVEGGLVGEYETIFSKIKKKICKYLMLPRYTIMFALYLGISVLCMVAFWLSFKSMAEVASASTIALVAFVVCVILSAALLALLIISVVLLIKNRKKEM